MPVGRKWQNLIRKQCPDCDQPLKEIGTMFRCETQDCGFGISRMKMAEILTDPNHMARQFMSRDDDQILINALREVGIENPEQYIRRGPKYIPPRYSGPKLPPSGLEL